LRIDKFLKNARLIKRRTVAKEACEAGRVLINDSAAKPVTVVSTGDQVVIRYAGRVLTIRVLGIADHVTKKDADDLYEIISEERIEADSLF
jgi:ribosomal 50S subunit-recycling heat shock protein